MSPAGKGRHGRHLTLFIILCAVIGLIIYFWPVRVHEPEPPAPISPPASAPQPSTTDTAAPSPPVETGEETVTPQQPEAPVTLEQEAREYVEDISRPEMVPIPAQSADDFVTPEQPISLIPDTAVETVTAEELQTRSDLADNAPITVVHETEQLEVTTAEDLIRQAGGNLEREVTILTEDDRPEKVTIGELLQTPPEQRQAPITVVKRVRNLEVITTKELKERLAQQPEKEIKVIRKPYRLESTTVRELLMGEEIPEDAIFYVRTVTAADKQGMWGIIHHGLIDNFARGIAIRRGEKLDTYRVDIPPEADELNPDRSSSYLGRLIHRKVLESYVYNFMHGKIGRNPDVIHPGQELIIIRYDDDELIDIYKHFVQQQG